MWDSVDVELDGKVRPLKFTPTAFYAAQRLLPGNMTVREALARHRGVGVVAVCTACALIHSDRNVSPQRVLKWIERDPLKYPELEAKIIRAAVIGLRELGEIEPEDAEELESLGNPSPGASSGSGSPGSSSSEGAGGSGSPSTSSAG